MIANANAITAVALFDVAGRQIFSQRLDNGNLPAGGKIAIDLHALANGPYICMLSENGRSRTTRLVQKQR